MSSGRVAAAEARADGDPLGVARVTGHGALDDDRVAEDLDALAEVLRVHLRGRVPCRGAAQEREDRHELGCLAPPLASHAMDADSASLVPPRDDGSTVA